MQLSAQHCLVTSWRLADMHGASGQVPACCDASAVVPFLARMPAAPRRQRRCSAGPRWRAPGCGVTSSSTWVAAAPKSAVSAALPSRSAEGMGIMLSIKTARACTSPRQSPSWRQHRPTPIMLRSSSPSRRRLHSHRHHPPGGWGWVATRGLLVGCRPSNVDMACCCGCRMHALLLMPPTVEEDERAAAPAGPQPVC